MPPSPVSPASSTVPPSCSPRLVRTREDKCRVSVLTSRRCQAFDDAMSDDLSVPRALGVLHETVRAGNTALADGDRDGVRTAHGAVRAMLDVLGLSPGDF